MDSYRIFLKKLTEGCLTLCLILSAVIGVLTFPPVSLWESYVDEESSVTTLSILLSGFCLARLLVGLWEKKLSPKDGFLWGLCAVLSLLVLPIREQLPFMLDGYVFPLLTGIAVPRLLLRLIPEGGRNRLSKLLAAVSGALLLSVSVLAACGALFAFRLEGVLLCRMTVLPLLWLAPCFAVFARRCGLDGRLLSISLWLLPLPAVVGIWEKAAFLSFPLLFLLTLAALFQIFDNRRKHRLL